MSHEVLRPPCGECNVGENEPYRIPSAAVAKAGSVFCETY